MTPRSVRSACNRGISATLVGHRMGDQKLIILSSSCFRRYVKPLVRLHLQLFTLTNSHWACVVGSGSFTLGVVHKEGLHLSSADIRLMLMSMCIRNVFSIIRFSNNRVSIKFKEILKDSSLIQFRSKVRWRRLYDYTRYCHVFDTLRRHNLISL
jgi:hypothetical protein